MMSVNPLEKMSVNSFETMPILFGHGTVKCTWVRRVSKGAVLHVFFSPEQVTATFKGI